MDPALNPETTALLQSLLMDRIGFLVLGASFLAVGLTVTLLIAVRSEFRHWVLILFGAMSLIWGLRFISRAPSIPLVIGGEPEAWALFTRSLAFFSAPPAFAFVWQVFGPGWKSSIKVLTWVSLAFAVGASVIMLRLKDPDRILPVFNVLILTGAAVVIANIVQPEFRQRRELKTLVTGSLISAVFIALENLRSLGIFAIPFDVEWIGVVILYLTLGYVAASHFLGVERQLLSLQQELATARQIQHSILPDAPPDSDRLAIATRYLPMIEVAGDFFDFARMDSRRCGFLIADVSGHGVAAALVAAMVKVAFQAQTGHCDQPERVLAGMNEMLGYRLEGKYVTASYVFIDTEAGKIRFAGAGHPPLFLKTQGGEVQEIATKGLMLGPFPEAEYTTIEQDMAGADRILMYTDGIVEAFNPQDEEFGEDRVKGLLSESGGTTAEEIADRLLRETQLWAGIGPGESLEDDLTLVVIDILPGGK